MGIEYFDLFSKNYCSCVGLTDAGMKNLSESFKKLTSLETIYLNFIR